MRYATNDVRDTAVRAYRATRVRARRLARQARRRWRAATPHQRQTVRLTMTSAGLGLALAVTVVTAAGPWDSGQRTAERATAARGGYGSGEGHTGPGEDGPRPAPEVLAAVGSGPEGASSLSGKAGGAPPPSASALADTLEPLLDDDALGSGSSASVVDAATGRQIFAADEDEPNTPASSVKLATGAAALHALGADHRIATRTVADGDRAFLVGGGDPTLSSEELSELADRTASALRDGESDEKGSGKGTKPVEVSLRYDTSRYEGPATHTIGPNENLATVTPLMVDQGRDDDSESGGSEGSGASEGSADEVPHGPAPRTDDPAGDAAKRFAEELEERGVEVEGKPKKEKAPRGAERLAEHRSAPLSELVERMLTHSDNDIAEALLRQTALAADEPASFKGGSAAVRDQLKDLGVPVDGAHFVDGSGLDRAGEVPAALLTRVLVRAADPDHAQLRPVLTGLPVAGFSGTLGDRYGGERDSQGAGLVRAKTGTLSGVNTLAGTVVDADGRLLVFAFMAPEAQDRETTQGALDRLAAALANCGCRGDI